MAVIHKYIDSKFNDLILSKNNSEAILKSLEVTFKAPKVEFENLKYSNDPNKFYPYFRGLINQYRDLGKRFTGHHFSKKLLGVIPEINSSQ